MKVSDFYPIFADGIMCVHFGWVIFNLFGFFLVLKFPKIKYLHLATLTFTAALMLSGNICPLTTLEQQLRQASDSSNSFQESFLTHYLNKAIYIDVSPTTIAAATTILAFTAIWLYLILPWIRKNKKQ